MTRMQAEKEADVRNSTKAWKPYGFWIAKPGHSLLEGWGLACLKNGKVTYDVPQ